MDAATGRSLGRGRFQVVGRLGEGGAGVVYEVRDRQSDSRLALKTVRGAGPEALVSLKREFRAVQDITHPNLVRLDELFEEDGDWFFTMELVDGSDWLTYVRGGAREGGADLERIRATLVQVVEALAALHAKGTVHRDVKPSNVLVAKSGHVKVLDFGIASGKHRIDDQSEGIVGTLAYMAPEQLLSEEATPAGDFYALGAMLYQALTGQLPYFDHEGHQAEAKLKGPATPVRKVAPRVPEDLASLCDELLRIEPQARPGADVILRVLGGGSASLGDLPATHEEFVGRTRELGALWEAFHSVGDGAPVAVVFEGASGVGKSALVNHFLEQVRGRALVLRGRCHEREYVPYKGIDAIVDDLAAYLGGGAEDVLFSLSNSAIRLLPRLFPVLKRVAFFDRLPQGSVALPEGDASELRARIFGAFRELMRRVTEQGPVVVTIDDVQWADSDSLALLSDLLAPPNPPALLLVCTRRISEEEGAASTFTLPGDVRTLRLGGLSEDELASLASHLAPKTPLADVELRALAKESGGHPLFLQELMRRRARGADLPNIRLDDALWDRVSLLDPAERKLVEATAIAGAPTALEVIVLAAGLSRGGLPQHLAALRSANLVKVSGNASGRVIEPYHDRVREAVARRLDGESRRGWHERLARALDQAPERDVERLALHWEGAGDAPRAAALFQEAADRASQAFAFDHAVDLYRHAMTLDPGLDRPGLRHALADALFNAGRGAEAGESFLALARAESDTRRAIELNIRAARSFLGAGHVTEGFDALHTILDAAHVRMPEGRFAIVFRILWHRMILKLRGFDLAQRDAKEVTDQERLRFDCCSAAAFGIGMADTIRGAVFQHYGARLALNLGDPLRAARGLCGLALSLCTGGLATAKMTAAAIAKARELSKGLDDPYVNALADGATGFATFMLEEWIEAEKWLSSAEHGFRDLRGVAFERGTARMMHGRALVQLGRFKDLEAYVGPPMRDAIRRNDLYAIVNTRSTVSAFLALVRDEVDEVEAELAQVKRLLANHKFQMQHVYCLNVGASKDLYAGAPDAALARLDAARKDMRASLFEEVQSIRVMMSSLRGRAHLALAARRGEGWREELAKAKAFARKLGKEGLRGAQGQSELLLAGTSAVAGDEGAAVAHLRSAMALFEDRGMVLHAASAGRALGGYVKGAEGMALVAKAEAATAAQEVAAPVLFMRHYAPGLAIE